MACVVEYVMVPRYALHEKDLIRQKGFGPLVSSQEERALLVPLVKHEKAANKRR